MREGRPLQRAATRTLRAVPRAGAELSEQWQDCIERELSIPVSMLAITDDELADRMGAQSRAAVTTADGATP